MNARVLALCLAGVATSIAACGSQIDQTASGTVSGSGGHATSAADATAASSGHGGASSSSASTAGVTGSGGATSDAGTDAAPFIPGLFTCGGCLCDGATHYCVFVHGGAPPGPPPMPMCDDDAGSGPCKPLPPECAQAPSCVCLTSGCDCSEANGGITVVCNLP